MMATKMAVFFFVVLLVIATVDAMSSLSVVANVRGKKYEVSAETVEEFTKQVQKAAGIEADNQCVLFRGKVLNPSDKLEAVGVSAGDILNVVKGRKPRQVNFAETASSASSKPAAAKAAPRSSAAASGVAAAPSSSAPPANPFGGADSAATQAEAMKNMNKFLDSDLDAYFGDTEQLEKARLQMLENIEEYEKMMPGFRAQAEAIATDPQKWQEAMQKAKESMLKLKAMRDSGKLSPDALFNAPASSPSVPDNG